MQIDYLIVGQGICGTLLSYELHLLGKRFLVIDDGQTNSASRVAGGLINPVTGKRLVKSWLYDKLIVTALHVYSGLEKELGMSLIRPLDMVRFHANEDEKKLFQQKALTQGCLHMDKHDWSPYFNQIYGHGIISPCYLLKLNHLLALWRSRLKALESLLEEKFDGQNCVAKADKVQYRDISARKIIFCNGVAGYANPLFSGLPFSPNKGQAMIAHIPELPQTNVYKTMLKIIPLDDELFWIGSSFEWKYKDAAPAEDYYISVKKHLSEVLKLKFLIKEHVASIRPSTADYKPFVGMHPFYPRVGILNGMGTKALLQAPFFAKQLAGHLCFDKPLMPEADIARFKKLMRIADSTD